MPEPFDQHISDSVSRQAWDDEYRRLHGVSPQAPTTVSEPPSSGYRSPGNVKMKVTNRNGQMDWDGTAQDFAEMFGQGAAQFMLGQAFAPAGLIQQQQVPQPALPYMEEPYYDRGTPMPMLQPASLPASFPVYEQPIAFPSPQAPTVQAANPKQIKSLKAAAIWTWIKAHPFLLLIWYLSLAISLGNPNLWIRGAMLGNPLLSPIVKTTDIFNAVHWAYALKLPYFVSTPTTPTPEKTKEPAKK